MANLSSQQSTGSKQPTTHHAIGKYAPGTRLARAQFGTAPTADPGKPAKTVSRRREAWRPKAEPPNYPSICRQAPDEARIDAEAALSRFALSCRASSEARLQRHLGSGYSLFRIGFALVDDGHGGIPQLGYMRPGVIFIL